MSPLVIIVVVLILLIAATSAYFYYNWRPKKAMQVAIVRSTDNSIRVAADSPLVPSTATDQPTSTSPPPVAAEPPASPPPQTSVPVEAAPVPPPPDCATDPSGYYYYYAPDVKAAGVDALAHWNSSGYKEGRKSCFPPPPPDCATDPSGYYYYYSPDVKAAGVDALAHWNSSGYKEGRKSCFPTPPAPPSSSPSSPTWVMSPSTAYDPGSLSNANIIGTDNMTSVNSCKANCSATSGCKGFVYQARGTTSMHRLYIFLNADHLTKLHERAPGSKLRRVVRLLLFAVAVAVAFAQVIYFFER